MFVKKAMETRGIRLWNDCSFSVAFIVMAVTAGLSTTTSSLHDAVKHIDT